MKCLEIRETHRFGSGMDKRFSFSFYNRVLCKSEGACKASTRHALKAAAALSTYNRIIKSKEKEKDSTHCWRTAQKPTVVM